MRKNTFIKVIASALAVLTMISVFPIASLAASFDVSVSNDYFTVISNKTYKLADGATESEIVLNNATGNDRKVVHVFEVDTKNENILVLPGYYGIDKLDPDNLSDSTHWTDGKVTDTAKYYEEVLGYNVLGAMNTALAYDSNAPYGYMVYEGVVLGTPQIHKGADTYLAIDWEGNCELRNMSTPLKGNERTAIPANFGWLVKNGKLTSTKVERTSSDASRSMVGVKADGTLVFCQVDGRNAPTSTGLSNYEMGEMMLGLGCVNAFNCDGGGSSTFVSKREGETDVTMRSIPSDGAERATINSVIIVSLAKNDGKFDHAVLSTDHEYYAPYSKAGISAKGVDGAGGPAEMPTEGFTWALNDDSFGTIDNGVFQSNGKKGSVTAQLLYNGNLVGEKVINIVDPDSFKFNVDSTVLPYGKSTAAVFKCTYGADNWLVGVDGSFDLSVDDPTAATIDGNVLTATTDESKSGVILTATYKADNTKTAVMNIAYGKGSEIVFDFENGEHEFFMGIDEAVQWVKDHNANGTIFTDGNFSNEPDNETFLGNVADGGFVKNGNGSLGVTLDYTTGSYASWTYNMFFYKGEPIVLRDVANGKKATTFGAWVYIPEGAAGLAMQLTAVVSKTEDGANPYTTQITMQLTTVSGAKKNLNAITEADIPESRWVYMTADLTTYPYVRLLDAHNPDGLKRHPNFIRFYVKPQTAAKLNFFYDDFTLDYSSAVDDRVLPTISNITYATDDSAIALKNDATIGKNSMAFSANVADNVGVTSAKIYVDGVAVPSAKLAGGVLSCDNVTLLPGKHVIGFEAVDALGNVALVTRSITVSGTPLLTVGGHNESNKLAEYGSIYYIDINAADASAIDTLSFTLKLQTANTWETIGAIVADGFEATFDFSEQSLLLNVTLKRVADVTGAQTLVSIPVRLWTWNGMDHVTGEIITPQEWFKGGYCPIVAIDCKVVYGAADLGEAYNGYLGAFGGNFKVDTMINDIANPWHYHDAHAIDDKPATCTKAGYTGRTYCDGCMSVVDWGTIVAATGHTYTVVDGKLFCDCGETVTDSGIISVNGKVYYAIAGNLQSGWIVDEGDFYYFDPVAFAAVDGVQTLDDGYTYTFENCILVKGQMVESGANIRYRWAGTWMNNQWFDYEGERYFATQNGNLATGVHQISNTGYFYFGEDYTFQSEANGLTWVNGKLYNFVDGSAQTGLYFIDGYYYYFGTALKGAAAIGNYYISNDNGLGFHGYHEFDEQGRMIIDEPETEPDEPETEEPGIDVTKNGIVEEGGKLFYYVDGVRTYAGLIAIDGYYYYVRTSGQVATGSYYVSSHNSIYDYMGQQNFAEDGKLLDADGNPVEVGKVDTSKNGIIEEDGKLFYYVEGVRTYAGLIAIDGYYYYVRSSGQVATGSYYVTSHNDLYEYMGQQTFAEDGKLLGADGNPVEVGKAPEIDTSKNGIFAENGALYYYVDGVRTYAGLIAIDGYYYYVRTSGQVATGDYFVSSHNGLYDYMGQQTFAEDGKLLDGEGNFVVAQ